MDESRFVVASSASGHCEEGKFKANLCEPTIGFKVKNQINSLLSKNVSVSFRELARHNKVLNSV